MSYTYYFLLMLFMFSPPLQSVLTLLLKMQICSKIWYYQETFKRNTNVTFTYAKFHWWETVPSSTKLQRSIQKHTGTVQTTNRQLPQFTLCYEPHPSTAGIKPTFYPFAVTPKLQPCDAHFHKETSGVFLRLGAISVLAFMYFWITEHV